MATLTSQLIVSLIDKVSAPSRAMASAMANMQSRIQANNRQMDAMRGRMVETAAVGYGLFKAISAPIKAAMEFESAMADVRKVVDFPTPEAFKVMSAEIIEMSTRIPITAKGLAEIVAAAGQAGMAGSELLTFTEVAAKVGVAFDMAAGETGQALAEIKTALNISIADTSSLADAMNYLSDTSASSATDIINYMNRVGAAGTQYGFLPEQTAAIGSAMISAGADANVAATSFLNVGRALAKGTGATNRQKAAMAQLGLNSGRVAKSLQADATGTFRDVMARINELPKHLQATVLSDIFGDEARAIAPLVTQLGLYDQAIGAVADKSKYLGSAQAEFARRAETSEYAMRGFMNRVDAVSIAIGSALLPAINSLMDLLGPVISAMARFADANPRLTASIIGVAAALVALRVAALAAQFSLLWMKGGLLAGAMGGLSLVSGTLGGFKSILLGLLNPIGLLRGAMVALRAALLLSGVGIVLGVIALAGVAIYNNWQNIGKAFDGFKKGFASAMRPITKVMTPVLGVFQQLFDLVAQLVGPIDDTTGAFERFGRRLGTSVGTAVRTVIQTFRDLPATLRNALSFENLGNVGRKILGWFSGINWGEVAGRLREGLSTATNLAWQGLTIVWDWAAKIADGIKASAVGAMVGAKFGAIDWSTVAASVGSAIGKAIELGFRGYLAGLNVATGVLSWLTAQVNAIDTGQLGASLAGVFVQAISFATSAIGSALSSLTVGDAGANIAGDLIAGLGNFLMAGADFIKAIVRGWFNFGVGFWSGVLGSSIEAIKNEFAKLNLMEVGRQIMQSLIDGMLSMVGQVAEAARKAAAAIPEKIGGAFQNNGVGSGVQQGASRIGSAVGITEPPGIAGTRAVGGPVLAGQTYMTGERGRELFTPANDGYVHNNRDTKAMTNGGGATSGPAQVTLGGVTIHVYGTNDPEAIANKIVPILERRFNEQVGGGQFDQEYSVA